MLRSFLSVQNQHILLFIHLIVSGTYQTLTSRDLNTPVVNNRVIEPRPGPIRLIGSNLKTFGMCTCVNEVIAGGSRPGPIRH